MSSKPKTTQTKENKNTTTNTQQTQTSSAESEATRAPWEPAQGYLTDLYDLGSHALNLTNNKQFAGDFITPATDAQRSSVQQLLAAAPGLSAGAEPLTNMALRIANGEFLDPNNPILTNAIQSVVNPIRTNLVNTILPSVSDAAVRGGAYGGTAEALLKNNAIDQFNRSAEDTGNKMTLDWLNSRFGDIFNAPGLFQGANALALAPGTVTGLAGETEHTLNQYDADNAVKKYENSLQAPWFGIGDFANLLTQGGFGTTTGTQSGTSAGSSTGKANSSGVSTQIGAAPDMATQILQGLTGGAGMLSSLGQAFPATMSAVGSGSVMAPILSGLSMLSDRRFKTDVERIGSADNGLPIYRFRYIGSPTYHIGFMADEVEQFRPEAVGERDGIKFVDYKLASEV